MKVTIQAALAGILLIFMQVNVILKMMLAE